MPKVDRRILKTKVAINNAFIELLSEKDFDKITVNDISDRADINRGTIYLHYADKFDLLDQCIQNHLNKMLDFCETVNNDQETFDVINSFLPVFLYFQENYLFYSLMLDKRVNSYFRNRLQSVIIEGIKMYMNTNEINSELDKEVLVQFMASAFVGTVEWWIKNKMPQSPQVMAQYMLILFVRNQC
ncbi:TetR/AcrR family transcriptional regulator [Clostridium sp. BL-8]|uniref:TetR/AcrR family transcriptional regulator n=1 Tax=Clostridium sp. BL-8 TaxID=349938 RepID=UPI00098CBEA3|nr:TetR/AcrR family transcriptional regulator [Clostridium sp. BL-8]OOM73401.1 HTH-type transcriptional regulator MtrR [Clostridium sp. BL-8]